MQKQVLHQVVRFFNLSDPNTVAGIFRNLYYPCSGYDFDVMRTLESFSNYIFCDDENMNLVWSLENKLGLSGIEVIEISEMDPKLLGCINEEYTRCGALTIELMRGMGLGQIGLLDEGIKRIVKFKCRLNGIKECHLIIVTAEAFSFYVFMVKVFQWRSAFLIKQPGVNGEESKKLLRIIHEETDCVLPAVFTTEFDSLEGYSEIGQYADIRLFVHFLQKDNLYKLKNAIQIMNRFSV